MWVEPLVITLPTGLGIGIAVLLDQVAVAGNLNVFFTFLVDYRRRGW